MTDSLTITRTLSRHAPLGGAVGRVLVPLLAVSASMVAACGQTQDLGDTAHGLLPVDNRNTILFTNDSSVDNWQGEYAILFAHGNGPKLAGIIVNTSGPWPNIDDNVAGWRSLVNAARMSGMTDVPYPVASVGPALVRPANGDIDATVPNHSEGARLIITASRGAPHYRPLVVVTGGRLTDVADAYLLDKTVVDRVIIVCSLGTATDTGWVSGRPNGEMDPWADTIVASKFNFVQVSAFYDQTNDIPTARIPDLPANPFGQWMATKAPNIWSDMRAADQVGILSVAVAGFATTAPQVAVSAPTLADAKVGPTLVMKANGNGQIVTQIAPANAVAQVWKLLGDPKTFAPR